MKKFLLGLLTFFIITAGTVALLNVNTTTRQGINYEQYTIQIPLYLKILDFYDRHFNYKQLVNRIIGDETDEEKKIKKIFSWTHQNIRRQPEELPVVDDHVWHIIVRGYGVSDQSSDVFTTLCNYAHVDAFFMFVYTDDRKQNIPLSFVKINKKWAVFDPYYGVYFKNKKDALANIDEIKSGDWVKNKINGAGETIIDYTAYLKNLPHIMDIALARANSQSPMNRLKYEINKWITLLKR